MGTTSISTARFETDDRKNVKAYCACGCNKEIYKYKFYWSPSIGRYSVVEIRFIKGHNALKGVPRTQQVKEKLSKSVKRWHEQVGHSDTTKEKIRQTLLKKRIEISERQKGKNNGMYGKTHSDEYKKRLSIEKRGPGGWNWKGGITYYRGEDWDTQRKLCYKRDKYTCQDCGIVRSKSLLSAHHLVDYIKTKDNRLENLITLCLRCHGKRHGRPKII